MVQIRESRDFCTFIVTVDADLGLIHELEAHARERPETIFLKHSTNYRTCPPTGSTAL